MKATDKGLKRILKAFGYSYQGLKAVIKSEAAFRQELVLCAVLSVVAFCLPVSLMTKLSLINSLIIILLAELINTAIETVIDRISAEYHELSKKAKDIGSLVVLLAFIYTSIFWLTTLYEIF